MLVTKYNHLGPVSDEDWEALAWTGRLMHTAGAITRERKLVVHFRCHSISRAISDLAMMYGNPHNLRVVDGLLHSSVVERAKHFFAETHTWLSLPSGAILDPYPPVVSLSPLLLPKPVNPGMGHTFWHCYRPGKFTKGQEEYLRSPELAREVTELVGLFLEAEKRIHSPLSVISAA